MTDPLDDAILRAVRGASMKPTTPPSEGKPAEARAVMEMAARIAERHVPSSPSAECEREMRRVGQDIAAAIRAFADYPYAAVPRSPAPPSADVIYEGIKHGDELHRKWLRDALDCLFAGEPVPPPYPPTEATQGKPSVAVALGGVGAVLLDHTRIGIKDAAMVRALIKDLQRQVAELQSEREVMRASISPDWRDHEKARGKLSLMLERAERAEAERDAAVAWAGRRESLRSGRDHLTINGKFQSDKYPWCAAGFVPLKIGDPMATDLLADYARRRGAVDKEFERDLLEALIVRLYKDTRVPAAAAEPYDTRSIQSDADD